MEMYKVDIVLQNNVQQLIELIWRNFSKAPTILTGGSTVEGAMLARFFKELREIEFDLNYLAGKLSKKEEHLAENIEGKLGKVKINMTDELLASVTNKADRVWLKECQHQNYLNTYIRG